MATSYTPKRLTGMQDTASGDGEAIEGRWSD